MRNGRGNNSFASPTPNIIKYTATLLQNTSISAVTYVGFSIYFADLFNCNCETFERNFSVRTTISFARTLKENTTIPICECLIL
jgi:hypothetical protein